MPLNIPPTTLPADGSYVSIALGSLYATGYLFLSGSVDLIMLYAPMTGQQQQVSYPNLPGGQYTISPGTKNAITGFQLRAPGGALASTVQYSLAMNEPTIPSILPAGGGALGPFRAGDGLQFGGPGPVYGAVNTGQYLFVEATGAGPNPPTRGTGIGFVADSGGFWFEADGAANPGYQVVVQGANNAGVNVQTFDSAQGILLTANGGAGRPGVKVSTVGTSGGIELETFDDGSGTSSADVTLLQGTKGQIAIQNSGSGGTGITVNDSSGGGIKIMQAGVANTEIDLQTAGNQLIVNDHLGVPLVTYTG